MKNELTIGRLAKSLSINIETIRFYERKGLIVQPAKPDSGFRRYSNEIAQRISFIKSSQKLGFTLSEISNLLKLNDQPCHKVQELAIQKLDSVSERIEELKKLEKSLKQLVRQCANNKDQSNCPIIDSLH